MCWSPVVCDCAGELGHPISCLRIDGGQNYRVHICGGSWLPAVSGNNENDSNNGYAGVKGRPIDAISISGGISYKVHSLNGKWYPYVNGYNIQDSNNGYAGVLGKIIDAIQINGRNFAVYYENNNCNNNYNNNNGCEWSNSGTGINGITYQKNIPNMKEGCLFMACCVKGGLYNTAQIIQARDWALSNGKIRSDNYVNNKEQLAKDISATFGTTYHPDYQYATNKKHHWLVDGNGNEIFNSAGLGYR